MCAHFLKPYPEGVSTKDFDVSGVPVRHYTPSTPLAGTLVVYAHGGGFVVGGLESHDDVCAEIADFAGCEVLAIDYRMAPEHVFPAAVDDCWTVYKWAAERADRIVLAGDSAGAKLSAAIAIKARDEGLGHVAGQVLIYGAYGGEAKGGSYDTMANAPGLTTEDVKFYSEIYFGKWPNSNWDNKLARPLLETDFSRLAPAFIVAAELDPLLDDSVRYAEVLNAAGVRAELRTEPDLIHGYIRARHMSEPAAESFIAICQAVKGFCHGGG
ncbi:MAG: alpha/beta hydrolase [Rhizobiales bacterium]|nr:alpha/beta hydrolase [Hyphomicrobiales bacterium]